MEPMIRKQPFPVVEGGLAHGEPPPSPMASLPRGSGPWIGHTCQSQMFQEESLFLFSCFSRGENLILRFGGFFTQLLSVLSKCFLQSWVANTLSPCFSESGVAREDHVLPAGTPASALWDCCVAPGARPSPEPFPQWVSRSLLALWF